MVRRLVASGVVVFAIVAGCAAPGGEPRRSDESQRTDEPRPPDMSVGVYGRVTDARTNAPLRDVCVTLAPPGEGGLCLARTDDAGEYAVNMAQAFQTPTDGLYEIYFSRDGYVTDHSAKQAIRSVVRVDFAMRRP